MEGSGGGGTLGGSGGATGCGGSAAVFSQRFRASSRWLLLAAAASSFLARTFSFRLLRPSPRSGGGRDHSSRSISWYRGQRAGVSKGCRDPVQSCGSGSALMWDAGDSDSGRQKWLFLWLVCALYGGLGIRTKSNLWRKKNPAVNYSHSSRSISCYRGQKSGGQKLWKMMGSRDPVQGCEAGSRSGSALTWVPGSKSRRANDPQI